MPTERERKWGGLSDYCPISGCTGFRALDLPVCAAHWQILPAESKRAWHEGRDGPRGAAIAQEIVEALELQLTPKTP